MQCIEEGISCFHILKRYVVTQWLKVEQCCINISYATLGPKPPPELWYTSCKTLSIYTYTSTIFAIFFFYQSILKFPVTQFFFFFFSSSSSSF
jgi:hypothetical protein